MSCSLVRDVLFVACRALPAGAVLQVLCDAAHAVASVHELGIVHYDLKEENFLVDDRGHVVLADFGCAAAAAAAAASPWWQACAAYARKAAVTACINIFIIKSIMF